MLREILTLSETRAELVAQLDAIDAKFAAITNGKAVPVAVVAPVPARRGRKPGKVAKTPAAKPAKLVKAAKAPKAPKAAPKKSPAKASKAPRTGRRGALKEQITGLLASAGTAGMAVKDIASQLGVKNQNVHVWFSTTGKKLAEITKVGEARYAFIAGK